MRTSSVTLASLLAMAAATGISPGPAYDSLNMPSFRPARLRASKARGRRMQRVNFGNPPGKYVPHQGAREMARRVRQMARGDQL